MRKKIIIVGIIIVMILTCILILLKINGNRNIYRINLPSLENLLNVTVVQSTQVKVIGENSKIEELLSILNSNGRKTDEKSIQDVPVNAQNEIKIDFNFKEGGISTIFVYRRKGKCYIEQPYNGIYTISEEEYNSLEKYAR